ncbi:3-dehydroquinate synthase [Aliidongia dinghuensis]|uniref:3-dehydroquinate synthase n=1 Tax=Aliidongia dinghuensis TaxID=1867774 RepID=A0A8J2Z167_9PROT|nr:3-dehydroquinate synthase [Aliidongia dinghuensis]GGF48834.1 3-dehydroquinate synthase [Aliidongia dinghuensis]
MSLVPVALAGRSYDILIERGLIARAGALIRPVLGARRLVVLTDENVARHHLAALEASLAAADYRFDTVVVPPGEQAKDLHRFPELAERLLGLGLERGTAFVALGGGVIGDLAGFAAATLLRGLDFVQVPTTLLAQIDSSVGGKTGVNARRGKNLVGAFHQPRLVLADLAALDTLPRREWLAGYAEMVKYGLLGDADFFARLERDGEVILAGAPGPLGEAVAHCCRMKAEIVAEDEREAGRRALLNLGHTFGHALEAETGYGPDLLHGEAVAIGMMLAADLSRRLGLLGEADFARIGRHLTATGLMTRVDQVPGGPFTADRLIQHMAHDKKVAEGRIAFVLMRGLGDSFQRRDVPPELVRDCFTTAGAV